jgi:hypothetical protein
MKFINEAKEERRALALVGYPSTHAFVNMVRSNIIRNCPVSTIDITNAHKMFGLNIAMLTVKPVRRTPEGVMTDYVEVPSDIINLKKNITLEVDNMFVYGLPFMVSISRKIKFTTVEYFPGQKQPMLVN